MSVMVKVEYTTLSSALFLALCSLHNFFLYPVDAARCMVKSSRQLRHILNVRFRNVNSAEKIIQPTYCPARTPYSTHSCPMLLDPNDRTECLSWSAAQHFSMQILMDTLCLVNSACLSYHAYVLGVHLTHFFVSISPIFNTILNWCQSFFSTE